MNKPTLRNNQDGTCNCRPLGSGCFFQEIDGSRCKCSCHNKPTFEPVPVTFESDTNSQVTIHSEKDVYKSDKWREEFEKRFGSLWGMNRVGVIYGGSPVQLPSEWTIIRYENMIDFISSLLSEERNKVRAILDRYYACGGHLCEDKLIKELEELVK